MANNVGVKQYLQGQGVASGDIGYDQNSGNVTVRGQNFLKPAANLAGTTYDSQQNLDSAYGSYRKNLPVIQTDGSIGVSSQGQPATNPAITTQGGTTTTPVDKSSESGQKSYTNPYTQMIGDLIKHLSDSSSAPQQDIYSTPQYAAAKANQDRMSADSIRHSSESAAGAGLGHSTIMTDRTQRIQNDSDQQLATQLVPQIQAQLQQQRQQELQNQQSLLNNYMTLGQQADNQHNQDRTFEAGRQDAATQATGIYNPSGQSVQDIQSKMDANSKAYASATPEEQARLHDENLQLASQLGKTYDSKSGTYSEGQGFAGTKTIQAKQLDSQLSEVAYGHARDSLLDKRYETKFNQDIQQQGFDNALKLAVQAHQISNDNAQLAISQQNANTSSSNESWARDPNNPDNIYKMAEIDKLKNGTSVEINKEIDGLYTGLSSGQITASAAIDEINGKVKAGVLKQVDANKMLAVIKTVTDSKPNVKPALTQTQIDASGGNNPQDLNSTQLDKLWNTDPTGKAAGRPSIDWGEWYTDPRGRVGGISYEAWKQAYGPQLKAR